MPYNYKNEQRILSKAIEMWNPRQIVVAFSGGYDSMIASHLVHNYLDTDGRDVHVWSIDTMLSADGWCDYVAKTARDFGWWHKIYTNQKGFNKFVKAVKEVGCPRTKAMHVYVYQKLKETGFNAIHMMYKQQRSDKTLFISGMRRQESRDRENAAEVSRVGKSNKIFCAPIVEWTTQKCLNYRLDHELPENPFYDTVKGSGDCQCNWGNFITMHKLKKYSPKLAAGNVALIDKLSRERHGYGWDGSLAGQLLLITEDYDGEGKLTTPFLCSGCSRKKPTNEQYAERITQLGLF